jgi:hypothetical protein
VAFRAGGGRGRNFSCGTALRFAFLFDALLFLRTAGSVLRESLAELARARDEAWEGAA